MKKEECTRWWRNVKRLSQTYPKLQEGLSQVTNVFENIDPITARAAALGDALYRMSIADMPTEARCLELAQAHFGAVPDDARVIIHSTRGNHATLDGALEVDLVPVGDDVVMAYVPSKNVLIVKRG